MKSTVWDVGVFLLGGASVATGLFLAGIGSYDLLAADDEAWRDHPCDAGYEACPPEAYPPEVQRYLLVDQDGLMVLPPLPALEDVPEPLSWREAIDRAKATGGACRVLGPGPITASTCDRPAWTFDPPLPPRRPDTIPERPPQG